MYPRVEVRVADVDANAEDTVLIPGSATTAGDLNQAERLRRFGITEDGLPATSLGL
jgi:hypothetical protein